MKKVLGTLVSIFMLLAILGGFKLTAHANSVYDFGIAQADDKTVVINAYYGDSAEVKIPSKIHGFTVVGIVEDAFYGREDIKKVTLPNTIKDIRAGVFKNTALYKNVVICQSVVVTIRTLIKFLSINDSERFLLPASV